MDISDDQVVAIRGRPARAQVAQHAGVGMAATHGIAAPIGGVRPGRTGPVHMVGVRADVFIDVGEDALATALIPVLGVALRLIAVVGVMLAALPEDPSSLDHVEEVRNDAHFGPEVAVLIEVDAPRIAAALGENLESVSHRMVTPHTGIDPLTIIFGGPRLANIGRTENPVATIEPTIGPPVEGVERLVGVSRVVPAIQQDLRITGRLGRITVGDGDEHQVGSRADPKTAEAKLHAGDQVHVFQKHRAFVGLVVAVGVLKHEDAVLAREDVLSELLRRSLGRRMPDALGIAQAFSYPEAAAVIFAKGDRVANIGLGGEHMHCEAGGQGGLGRSVGCREPCKEHLIGGRRGVLGGVLERKLVGQHRAVRVEAEVVEIQVPPMTGAVVHQADADLLAHQALQLDDHRAEGFVLGAGNLEEGLAGR